MDDTDSVKAFGFDALDSVWNAGFELVRNVEFENAFGFDLTRNSRFP